MASRDTERPLETKEGYNYTIFMVLQNIQLLDYFIKLSVGVSRTSQQTKKKSFQIDATYEMLVSDKWLKDYLLVAEENPTGFSGSRQNWE